MLGVVRWMLADFGPLILFWALDLALGIKPAIAGSVLYILGDCAWRWRRGLPFSRVYRLSAALTVVFGGLDLLSATPFMLKYESVVTNVFTGLVFVWGARGPRPMVLELAEQRRGEPLPQRVDIIRFFQLFTLLWAAYFFIKAGFYLVVATTLPMTQAMLLHSVVGSGSMALMAVFSVTQGRRLFTLCQRLRLLPRVAETGYRPAAAHHPR
jgi:intracellular septation protein A